MCAGCVAGLMMYICIYRGDLLQADGVWGFHWSSRRPGSSLRLIYTSDPVTPHCTHWPGRDQFHMNRWRVDLNVFMDD